MNAGLVDHRNRFKSVKLSALFSPNWYIYIYWGHVRLSDSVNALCHVRITDVATHEPCWSIIIIW